MNSLQEPEKNIYIELDVLFDTRYGVLLHEFGEEFLNKHLNYKEYVIRKEDRFNFIDNSSFKYLYSKRDINVFKKPLKTFMSEYLAQRMVQSRANDLSRGGDGLITLYVNTAPYRLVSQEMERLKQALQTYFHTKCKIEFVYHDELNVKFINKHVYEVYSYGGLELLNKSISSGELYYGSFTDKLFIVPDNIGDIKDRDEMIERMSKEIFHPFVNLEFVHISWLSYIK